MQASVNGPVTLVLVTNAYDCPIAVLGTIVVIILPFAVAATLVVSSPLTNVMKNDDGSDPVTENVNGMPSAVGCPCVAVRLGNALTGSAALVEGQDLMKAAARVKTGLRPSAVPYGEAGPIWPRLKRCRAVCRDSVTRMEPATPR